MNFQRIKYLLNWLIGRCTKKYTKCEKCSFDDIHKIIWHDLVMHKCDKCGYVKLKTDEMIKLGNNIVLENNIGDIRRKSNLTDIGKKDAVKISRLIIFHRDGVKKNNGISATEPKKLCNSCGSELGVFFCRNGFTYYYCPYCGSFYFLQKDYDEVIKKYV